MIICNSNRFAYLDEIEPAFNEHIKNFFSGYILLPTFIETDRSAYQKDYESQNRDDISVKFILEKNITTEFLALFKSKASECLPDFRVDNFTWTGHGDDKIMIFLIKETKAEEGRDWMPEAADVLQKLSKNFVITSSKPNYDEYDDNHLADSVDFEGHLK